MTGPGAASLAVGGLLTIDVGAEIERLTEATLAGPWQVPAELVRRAMRAGAHVIRVELGRGRLAVRDDGRALAPEVVRQLAVALDRGASAGARHRALAALEAEEGLALLALVGLAPGRLSLETSDGPEGQRLVIAPDRAPRVEPTRLPARTRGTTLELRGVSLDPQHARRWLEAVCRFAPALVTVDGREAPRGFDATLAEAPLAPPLEGRIVVPRAGDVARLWLLADGVVSAHLTLPSAPAFEAAVEMRGLAGPLASAGAVREAIEPHLARLVEAGVRLALDAASSLPQRDESERRQVRSILLAAAQKRWCRAEVLAVPMVPALLGPLGRETRWLSLADAGQVAEASAGRRALWALYPGQDPARFLLPGAPILVLDAEERSRLVPLLGLELRPPPPRPGNASWRTRARDGFSLLAAGLERAAAALRPSGKPVPDAALSAEERALVEGLRAGPASRSGDPSAVLVCAGRGRVRRSGGRWLLPRESERVRACVRAVASDPAWIYPAGLALIEGRGLPRDEARRLWRRMLERPQERPSSATAAEPPP